MLAVILCWWLGSHTLAHAWDETRNEAPASCLAGYMTDTQQWVNGVGQLTNVTDRMAAIDLSGSKESQPDLMWNLRLRVLNSTSGIKSLSLARCGLVEVPTVFSYTNSAGRQLFETVEYVTFYGNRFSGSSKAVASFTHLNPDDITEGSVNSSRSSGSWGQAFAWGFFKNLRELDLRSCNINSLEDPDIFRNMPTLEALYLGENSITHIPGHAFSYLKNLVHLDLSRNSKTYGPATHMYLNESIFNEMTNLLSLDLSYSKLDRISCLAALENLGSSLKRLSLCYTSLSRMPNGMFRNTPLAYLDVSGNNEILEEPHALAGLENSLQVLYADSVDLRSLQMLTNFKNLEVLRLRNNEITRIPVTVMAAFENLQILDLAGNRLTTWVQPLLLYGHTTKLKLLSIRDNNLNLISEEMMTDFSQLSYLAVSENSIVCNCHLRELFEISYRNEYKDLNEPLETHFTNTIYPYTGFKDYQNVLNNRQKVSKTCENQTSCSAKYVQTQSDGQYLLIDYENDTVSCLLSNGGYSTLFDVPTCKNSPRLDDFPTIQEVWAKVWVLIVIPIFVFPLLIFVFVFRRNLRYFCVMVKNTATLSLINRGEVIDDGSIFTYDVFVSYCNDDRDWVLDHLLPHLEQDCNVSLCLHERDFQVGLSILENIVSCMDRSRSILLLLSRRFLLSHWCQFEMHLAQHRLLETRREDLILILLEEIPRGIRPTTLHYLMLTKTYAVWPEDQPAKQLFWRRLKKSLTARRLVTAENVSLA